MLDSVLILAASQAGVPLDPNPLWIIPFGVLLASIALAPLLLPKWWHGHFPKVAIGLGSITLCYYLFGLQSYERVMHTAIEYVSFIVMIGALYVVSGGIHINVKGEATPWGNVLFLLFGAVIANLLGTTGASMLLIRPWIRMNKYRITGHHVVFFIFIVSNVGGCLTPIGDPPLFLGYIKGIPFFWVTAHLWPMWLVGVGMLLATFVVVDWLNYRKAPKSVRDKFNGLADRFEFKGLANVFFLLTILVAIVFVPKPLFLREVIMLAAAAGSYFTTNKHIHALNHFDFFPIKEVGILFIGIFCTMMPALDWLGLHAREFGQPTPSFYYWGSGILSAVLDNAPTYLSFLSAMFGALITPDVIQQLQHLVQTGGADFATYVNGPETEHIKSTWAAMQLYYPALVAAKTISLENIEIAFLLGNARFTTFLMAISIGAVFYGACTYIGNGPNFMVKAIAEHQKIHTPSFLGYVFKYSIPFMLPMLIVVWLLFFR